METLSLVLITVAVVFAVAAEMAGNHRLRLLAAVSAVVAAASWGLGHFGGGEIPKQASGGAPEKPAAPVTVLEKSAADPQGQPAPDQTVGSKKLIRDRLGENGEIPAR